MRERCFVLVLNGNARVSSSARAFGEWGARVVNRGDRQGPDVTVWGRGARQQLDCLVHWPVSRVTRTHCKKHPGVFLALCGKDCSFCFLFCTMQK